MFKQQTGQTATSVMTCNIIQFGQITSILSWFTQKVLSLDSYLKTAFGAGGDIPSVYNPVSGWRSREYDVQNECL